MAYFPALLTLQQPRRGEASVKEFFTSKNKNDYQNGGIRQYNMMAFTFECKDAFIVI